jgi:hypothetical protein
VVAINVNTGVPDTGPLKTAAINVSSSGVNPLIAGISGQTIAVYKLLIVAAGTVTAQFQNGASNLTGAISLITGTPLVFDFDSVRWFLCSAGNTFNVNLGTGVQVSGVIFFTQQ